MQTGKKVVNLEDGNVANFYFDEEGVMKTGKQVIFDEDLGETQNWYFHTDGSRKGQGFHGIKDNVLYVYGLRQEADKDLRFAPVELNGNQYLVNSNGAVQKATSSSKSTPCLSLAAATRIQGRERQGMDRKHRRCHPDSEHRTVTDTQQP